MKKEPPLRDYRFHLVVLGVILVLLVGILILWPKTAHSEAQGVNIPFLEPIAPHYVPYIETYGAIVDRTMTLEETIIADCVWNKESSRGQNMFGDYRDGVPMAYGHFQIWLSLHLITYECAMDYNCSLSYFLKEVRMGNGELWTTYKGCLNN